MSNIVKRNERGSLIIISGPSGCGKGTLISKYLERHDNVWLSISCTSRPMRPGDVENQTYYFLTEDEFKLKIENEELLEYNYYNGNYYGTPKEHIEEKLQTGFDVILEIDVNGAMNVKKIIPEAICIFILPPTMKELRQRLVGRGTESKDKILDRFRTAYKEINRLTDYNYVVTNDVIEDALNKIGAIMLAAKCDIDRIEEIYLNNEEEEIHELLMEQEFINEDIKL